MITEALTWRSVNASLQIQIQRLIGWPCQMASDWSDTGAAERVSLRAGDDLDSVIGLSLQVMDQLLQVGTWLIDDQAWVTWVGSVVRVQNLQRVEMVQLLQLQEVIIGHVMMPEKP